MTFKLPEKVEVTQDHISKGCQSNAYDCPIAMAFLDISKWDGGDVAINSGDAVFYQNGNRWNSADFDANLESWITRYDFSKNPTELKPITLILKENQKGNQYYKLEE